MADKLLNENRSNTIRCHCMNRVDRNVVHKCIFFGAIVVAEIPPSLANPSIRTSNFFHEIAHNQFQKPKPSMIDLNVLFWRSTPMHMHMHMINNMCIYFWNLQHGVTKIE